MKTEKDKMLAGELYWAWDKELAEERKRCRKILSKLNQSQPMSKEWKMALSELLPHTQGKRFIEPPFHCDYGSNIIIGANFFANFNCTILDANKVTIGKNVLLAPNVQIYTATHPLDVKTRVEQALEFALPITIGDNVWIGGGAIICPGINIGENTVIGAGSVVTKNIPANVMAAGNPCKIIKTLPNDSKLPG